jgi:hypothetical protein
MVQARVRPIGMREIAVVIAIFAIGWTVRWWHLGTASLWWDEMVHLSFALAPDPWQVFRSVRLGIPAGGGNAGAVPLDYLLLNAWTWFVGRPSVEQLEAYYRFPSYVWSSATLVVLWAYCRATFGRVVALTASALLALSIPHVLYAAEARFYSLLMLMSVLNLTTFTWVVRRPELPRAWVAYGVVNVLFFLTGVLSLLVLPWQWAALALAAVRDGSGGARLRRAGLLALTVLGLASVFALYYASVDLGARGIRPGAGSLSGSLLARQWLDFVTLGNRWQLALYALGAVVAPWYCWRRRPELVPVVVTVLVIELATIPLLLQMLQWKRYYFHPRHVLFLLPPLELLAALGVCGTLGAVAAGVAAAGRQPGRGAVAVAALLTVLALRLPAVRGFMARPHDYFARTKTDRDVKALARDLRSRTAFYGPGERYLLIVDRVGPGYLANPTLARYLQWYSLDKHVVLLGTTDMPGIMEKLRAGCDGPCRGRPGAEVAQAIFLGPPFEITETKLRLLGLRPSFGRWPGTVRDVGVLVYAGTPRRPDYTDTSMWPYIGMVVAEPR